MPALTLGIVFGAWLLLLSLALLVRGTPGGDE